MPNPSRTTRTPRPAKPPRPGRCPYCGRPGTGEPCDPYCPTHQPAAAPTPGQIAYAAYHQAYDPSRTWMTPWTDLTLVTRACWEAAAQAAPRGNGDAGRPVPARGDTWACRETPAGWPEVVCPACGWICLLPAAGLGAAERHWAEVHGKEDARG